MPVITYLFCSFMAAKVRNLPESTKLFATFLHIEPQIALARAPRAGLQLVCLCVAAERR